MRGQDKLKMGLSVREGLSCVGLCRGVELRCGVMLKGGVKLRVWLIKGNVSVKRWSYFEWWNYVVGWG